MKKIKIISLIYQSIRGQVFPKRKKKSRPKQQQQKVNEKTVSIKSTQVSRKNPRTIYV